MLRDLAFNPADRLYHVAGVDGAVVYGLDRTGRVRKTFGIRNAALRNLSAIVFAPSSDPSGSRSIQHMYAADAGDAATLGRVVELALNPRPGVPQTVTAILRRVIDTSKLQPPLPDPSGIAYQPGTDVFLVSDSEVEETPLYRGLNLLRIRRNGGVVDGGTTLPWSREPSGVSLDPGTGTLYVSDDEKDSVWVFQPGGDSRHGTGDDTVTRIHVAPFGIRDPEGVEFDTRSGHILLANGGSTEIYDIDPVDDVFGDGNDVVTHFDVGRYGLEPATSCLQATRSPS